MNTQEIKKRVALTGLVCLASVSILACGGGGDSSAASTAPTLNLNAAYKSFIIDGSTETGVISGYCQGARVLNYSATYSGTTLDGTPALISNNTETDTLAPNSSQFCKSFYSSNNGGQVYKIYYDPSTIVPITSGSNPKAYVYSNQVAPPTSVTVGSTGTLFTYQDYLGTPVPITSGVLTWAVTADTPTTLLWTTTDTSTLIATGQIVYKSITTYRLNANNTLKDLYKHIEASTIATQGQGDQNIYEVYQ